MRPIGQHHAALGAGDDFHRMKAEHRHRCEFTAADRPPGVGRTDRVRRIFDHGEVVALGQFGNLAHVAALPGERHRY
ncbi:hypothetical protein D3C81_1608050 [compost metagenome]